MNILNTLIPSSFPGMLSPAQPLKQLSSAPLTEHVSLDLKRCEEMIRHGSSSFHAAFGFLPSPRREAVFVIYAFCRLIDDAVDEPEHSPYSLDELEKLFSKLEDAQGHFIWPALRWLFAQFPSVDREAFLRQMEGQRRDLVLKHYETMEQLEQYCYLVAGTVGEMLIPVLHDAPTREVVEGGIWLGKAMQIVNIVRDVGEDKERDRRYLPLELLDRHGYSLASFAAGRVNASFRAAIAELEALAASWFARGLRHIDSYPVESAFSIELAAAFYHAILGKVKANRYHVFTKRAVVGPLMKRRLFATVKSKYALSREHAQEQPETLGYNGGHNGHRHGESEAVVS